MKTFKITLIGAMTLFVCLCVYWAIGRNVMIDSIGQKIESLQSDGYDVIHKGLSVGGFPIKFRANLAKPNIVSPRNLDKPWSIKSEALRLEALAINPLSWRGVHRGDARLDLRGPKGERWLFDARPFNIDFTAKLSLEGQLKAFDISGSKLNTQAVIGTLPPIIAIEDAYISASPNGENIHYDVDLKNLFLEKEVLKVLQKLFGPRLETLKGTIIAEGLQGLDTNSIDSWKSSGQLRGENWIVSWGGTVFTGRFDLSTSANGLSGIIRIDVDDITILLDRFQTANVITARQTRNAKLAAVLLPVNEQGRQEITLTLRDGYLTLFGQKIFEL